MGIFDIMLHVRRLMMFGLAVLIGFLFQYMAIPIPFLLGGIVSSMFWKVIGAQVYWPRQWRELGLCVAGYGIGRNFTAETMHELSMQSLGVLEATGAAVGASVIIAWWTSRHSYANLQSCVMGCMPGGLTQMMLMSETDKRVDFSVVMVMQTLRLMSAIIIVPVSGCAWPWGGNKRHRTSGSTNRRLHLAVDGAYRSNWRCCSAKAAYTNAAPVGAYARRVCLLILFRHLSARARPSHDSCANKHRPVHGHAA